MTCELCEENIKLQMDEKIITCFECGTKFINKEIS